MSNVFAVFPIGSVAFGGPIGVGVKVGVPGTELVMSSDQIVAPTGPEAADTSSVPPAFNLAIEVDALYRSVKYASGSSWEFPILAKYLRVYLISGARRRLQFSRGKSDAQKPARIPGGLTF